MLRMDSVIVSNTTQIATQPIALGFNIVMMNDENPNNQDGQNSQLYSECDNKDRDQVRFIVMSDSHQFYKNHLKHLSDVLLKQNSKFGEVLLKQKIHHENDSGNDPHCCQQLLLLDQEQHHHSNKHNKQYNVLLHCGDFGFYGKEKSLHNFNNEFLANVKDMFDAIIVILGNHDHPFMEAMDFNVANFKHLYLSNATHLLFDSAVSLFNDRVKIHGVSWQSKEEHTFCFHQYPSELHEELVQRLKMKKLLKIEKDTNILLSHEPPQGNLDDGSGSKALSQYILNASGQALKVVAFGHVHSKYGYETTKAKGNRTVHMINAAVNMSNAPVYFDYFL
ncbi:hypothetical protein C9374_002420 [Naegleria lovaniensis]|uniref:Calcineurin-like phosphoesterase domain-containing protein n=1 Tax=Naegleria lovaniensis TaxID=51637 RepID=A0AA88GVM6_NAELO|nr:uncharacterized protein C9374_002420 [Naegleria lovaniensis]KAG2386676.1 hypothetical protein C9374_002420 [Naegleria lovaniensis]